jgi:hypothetical protein
MARAKPKAERPLSEAELTVLLRERFAAPEYAFMPHVRNGTGYTRRTTRTADALSMSLWPSRGLDLHGFELKSDRADWVREKENPEKAEEIARFCDRWWIVVGRLDIVQTGELPSMWGLLAPKAGKLVVVKEAPKLEAKPLDRAQLAAILRRAAECVVPKVEIDAEMQRRISEIQERADKEVERLVDGKTRHLRHDVERYERYLEEFQKASGIDIRGAWQLGRIGEAVRFIVDGGLALIRPELEQWRDRARAVAAALDEQLALAPPATKTGTEG